MNIGKDRIKSMASGSLNSPKSITPIDNVSYVPIQPDFIEIYSLSEMITNELIKRVHDEYEVHFFYRNAANWLRDANYKKAAAFFEAEAVYEMEHAKLLQDYMADFNRVAIIPSMPMTTPNYENFINNTIIGLPEIIRKSYEFELRLMRSYNETSTKAFNSGDLVTFDFLQHFRNIQKESVIEYNDLINALELINKNNKLDLLYFEQIYF